MESLPLELGVGGIFVVMVLHIVRDILKSRKNGNGGTDPDLVAAMKPKVDRILGMQKDLHGWHSPDPNGEQAWRGHRVSEAVDNNTEVLQRLIPLLEKLERDHSRN